jgi:threonine/homoserine/homoserine lactone efflux protein
VASLDFGYSKGMDFILFFSTVLLTVLGTDILKAYLAGKLRALVTQRFLMIMNIILGSAMMVYGLRLVYFSVTNQGG